MKGEKVVDGYIYFASFHETTRYLDDAQYGRLMKIVNDYAFYEIEPVDELPDVLNMAFGLIKPQIDANKRKRAEYLQNIENGKRGGAPTGNKNAVKKQSEQPPVVLENNPPCIQETTPQTTIINNENVNVNENGNGNGKKQPPLFLFVINKAKEHGFYLDDDKAIKCLISELDPHWLVNTYNFIDFIAETVREGYGEKPEREQHRVFRKLLFNAPNLRDEYPAWRQKQDELNKAVDEKIAIDLALSNHPTRCKNCGRELYVREDDALCKNCGAKYMFDLKNKKWDYHGPPPEKTLSEALAEKTRSG